MVVVERATTRVEHVSGHPRQGAGSRPVLACDRHRPAQEDTPREQHPRPRSPRRRSGRRRAGRRGRSDDRRATRDRRRRPRRGRPDVRLGDLAFELPGAVALLGGTGKAEEVTRVPTRGTMRAPARGGRVGLGAEPGDTGAAETPMWPSRSGARPVPRHGSCTGRRPTSSPRSPRSTSRRRSRARCSATTPHRLQEGPRDSAHRAHARRPGRRRGRGCRQPGGGGGARRPPRPRLRQPPPNDLYPSTFAQRARSLAEAAGVSVEIADESALAGTAARRRPGRRRWVLAAAAAGPAHLQPGARRFLRSSANLAWRRVLAVLAPGVRLSRGLAGEAGTGTRPSPIGE